MSLSLSSHCSGNGHDLRSTRVPGVYICDVCGLSVVDDDCPPAGASSSVNVGAKSGDSAPTGQRVGTLTLWEVFNEASGERVYVCAARSAREACADARWALRTVVIGVGRLTARRADQVLLF